MSTKFFTNATNNTLFDKFKGLAQNSKAFEVFDAVTGFFRASGYFKVRRELEHVEHIRVLIGIEGDVYDTFFAKHDKNNLFAITQEDASKCFRDAFVKDVRDAKYTKEVEEGIIQLFDDVRDGRVELRMHASRNLHAKFYLCLPKNFNENSGGTVIMGSSNLTDTGLGTARAERYELNIEVRDYDDVKFCKDEFERLWKESLPITAEDLEKSLDKTYLGVNPTPYDIYMKVLIDTFGSIAEDDFNFYLPSGIMDLRYQRDAAIQGFQMLLKHHGFYLADVVGLGKTLVAMMVVQRFVFENGATSKVLVVTPPSAQAQWEDMRERFKGMKRCLSIVTNGKLKQVLDNGPENYDLIVVDEAHGFRNLSSQKFQDLQTLCKTKRINLGRLNASANKYVMLLSATPLNNYPSDLRNQVALFQDTHSTTFDNIPDLAEFFAPLEQEYKNIQKSAVTMEEAQRRTDAIYNVIRDKLLAQIMVRRTRTNIQNDKDYKEDLANQKVVFPRLSDPKTCGYLLDDDFSALFAKTVYELSEKIQYARYRAVEFLIDASKRQVQTATALAGIFRIHMVKRLESSIPAFRSSLRSLIKYTDQMLNMFAKNKIVIAPDYDVKDIIDKHDGDIDAALAELEKNYSEFKAEDHVYATDAFRPDLLEKLRNDSDALQALAREWDALCERVNDPKLEVFKEQLTKEGLFNPKTNPSGKLVVFTESAETAHYLCKQIEETIPRLRRRSLCVESKTFNKSRALIQANFDANFAPDKQRDDIKILFTTDALAEGINLHRANVIVHYDTPWNATRLMQRIGRVNRIGSTSPEIHNIVFYPSAEGDEQIRLCQNAFVKISAFHAALGEDARIFSSREILHEMKMYEAPETDDTDVRLALLREVQDLYANNPDCYRRIQQLPDKARVFRAAVHATDGARTLVFLRASQRVDYYRIDVAGYLTPLTFVEAAKAFRAELEEKASKPQPEHVVMHMKDVESARIKHQDAADQAVRRVQVLSIKQKRSGHHAKALKALRSFERALPEASIENVRHQIDVLKRLVNLGRVAQLEIDLAKRCPKSDGILLLSVEEIRKEVSELYEKYKETLPNDREDTVVAEASEDGLIIVSETFA